MIWLRYAPSIVVAAALGFAGWTAWSWKSERDMLRVQLQTEMLLRQGCEARRDNLQEDKTDDDQIDRIPDDGLRNAPDRWLLHGDPGSGGLY